MMYAANIVNSAHQKPQHWWASEANTITGFAAADSKANVGGAQPDTTHGWNSLCYCSSLMVNIL